MSTDQCCISRSKYDAFVFDLDGVVTQTARVHAEAWKELFDAFLAKQAGEEAYEPFRLDRKSVV